MKKRIISLRLDEEEYTILNNTCTENHISISDYLRTYIRNSNTDQPAAAQLNAEIAKAFCIIHARMDNLRFYDEEIEEELENICQMLL